MSFKDYPLVPADVETVGDAVYVGPNMARNDVRPALQQLAADGRALYDFVGTFYQSIYGPAYSSITAGLAATDSGDLFLVKNIDQTFSLYLNDGGVAVLQQSLVSETLLASTAGAGMVGTAEGGTVQARLRSLRGYITPEEKGATGDGVSDDRAAFDAARQEAIATGKVLRLAGQYNIGTGLMDLGAVTIEGVGSAPRIIGGAIPNAAGRSIGASVTIDFNSGSTLRRETLSRSYKRSYAEKSLWLGAGDQKPAQYVAIAPASLLLSINDFPGSDAWPIGAYGALAATGIGFTPDTDLRWYAATTPVHGGMELEASISGDDLNRGAVAIGTGGAFGFYASDFGLGTWFYKPTGGAVQTGTVDWQGRTTHESWIGKNMGWSIRFYDSKNIGVLINGMEIYRFTLPTGHIVRGGFMLMRLANGADGAVEFVTASRIHAPQGGRVVKLAIYGDSKSAPYFGAWSDAFREALDGSAGIRVTEIVNRAVSGQNSLDQYNVMVANPPTGMSDCVIHIGTNDIQAGATPEVSQTNITNMIDLARANGCRVHVVVPDHWYSAAQAGGFGEATISYQNGSRTRSAILNLAASKGCTIVNLPQVLGQVLGTQITAPDASDPRLRDAIHHTEFAYRVVGMEIARAVLRDAVPVMKRAVARSPMPVALENGWTGSPFFSVSEDGRCSLSGVLNPGTKADGTVLFTLPRNLWPATTEYLPAWIGNGDIRTVEVDGGNGQVRILGASTSLYLGLSGVSFDLASLFS